MEPVSELVRQREHRAAIARVVHEDVRVHSRHVRCTEGAGPLAVARRGVDPALAEEALDDVARLGREVRERAQHELGSVGPAHMGGVVRERRHAVVEREPVEPEEARLERVVALDDVVAMDDRVDERLHGLVGGVVREVARRDPRLVAAEAVVDRLVDGDRVEDVRARPETRVERDRHGLGGATPLVAIRGVELRHRFLEADLVPVEVDLDRTQELVVQTVPRAEPGDRLLREDLLLRLGEDVRPELPNGPQPVAPALELVTRDERVGLVVLERSELEPEEEELGVDRRALLGEARDERTALRVGHIRREPEVRVVDRTRERRLDPFALLDRVSQVGRAQLGDASVVPLTKRGGRCLGCFDIALDAWVVA